MQLQQGQTGAFRLFFSQGIYLLMMVVELRFFEQSVSHQLSGKLAYYFGFFQWPACHLLAFLSSGYQFCMCCAGWKPSAATCCALPAPSGFG